MTINQDKVNEDLLMALIRKGGTPPVKDEDSPMTDAEHKAYYDKVIPYQLRMPRWLCKKIDQQCQKEAPRYYSRHGWIMNAILTMLAKGE